MNITLSVSGELEELVKKNSQVKWTEIARQAIRERAEKIKKLEILEKYIDKKPISAEEWQWIEKKDCHPVDELNLKQEFSEEVLKSSNVVFKKAKTISDVLGD